MTPISFEGKRSAIDWIAFGAATTLALLGLVTMSSFQSDDPFFFRQVVFIIVGIAVFFLAANIDWRFLRRGSVAAALFAAVIIPLLILVAVGTAMKGARSWF